MEIAIIEHQTAQHRTTEVDRLSVLYSEVGERTGPKLLLLGGFPTTSPVWTPDARGRKDS